MPTTMTAACAEPPTTIETRYGDPHPVIARRTLFRSYRFKTKRRHSLAVGKSYVKYLVQKQKRRLFLQNLSSVVDHIGEISLEQRFRQQAEKWQQETQYLSSPAQRMMHPSYQAILGMGREVVPFMLRDLKENRTSWFWALSYLTQDNPISPTDAGKADKMVNAWLNWGNARGLL